jgi:hypothetical protein
MLGAIGGFSGWLWNAGIAMPAAILLFGAVMIVAAGYAASSRQAIDGTTEVVALVVLAAGVFAGIGSIRLASAIIAIAVLLLVEKSRLHAAAKRIDDIGMRSAVRFAIMALVVLPLLPEGPYGPLGRIHPRELWALVLFFSGLSFAGDVVRRLVGPGHGYLVLGLLGGLVSSTNVTFTFARTSRPDGGRRACAWRRCRQRHALSACAGRDGRPQPGRDRPTSPVSAAARARRRARCGCGCAAAVIGRCAWTPAAESIATRCRSSDGRALSRRADGDLRRSRALGRIRRVHLCSRARVD